MKDKIRVVVWGTLALAIILTFVLFSPRRSLYDAVADGNYERVLKYLDQGADINKPSPWQDLDPKVSILGLLEFGKEGSGRYGKGYTPLLIAAIHQDVLVKTLIDRGADVDKGTPEGYTPLMASAAWQCPYAAQVLLKSGADPNKVTDQGETALHFAASLGNRPGIIVMLVTYGADINSQDADGRTPLHSAVKRVHRLNINVLMKYGADPNIKDKLKKTPMDYMEEYMGKFYEEKDRKLLEE